MQRNAIAMTHQTSGQAEDVPNVANRAKSNAIAPMLPWTDLNNCLALVFDYLTVADLTHAAEAHPDFAPAAQMVYQFKFGHLELEISNGGHTLEIKGEGELYVIVELLMKHFGKQVSQLKLDYRSTQDNDDSHHWRDAERYIFEHCTESLTAIQLLNCRHNALEEILKMNHHIEKLQISYESLKIDYDFMQFLNETCSNLVVLDLAITDGESFIDKELIHFKKVK